MDSVLLPSALTTPSLMMTVRVSTALPVGLLFWSAAYTLKVYVPSANVLLLTSLIGLPSTVTVFSTFNVPLSG